jgi:ORF6N domain-containing protein
MAMILKPENLARLVFFVRCEKVMLDADLALLYGVSTKALNQAFWRNQRRFPEDFDFRLTRKELEVLRSQIVTTSQKRRRSDALPYAFTEQGVAMLSSVLRSPRAIEVNIAIMRTFVQLRRLMDTNRDLARKSKRLRKNMMSSSQWFSKRSNG